MNERDSWQIVEDARAASGPAIEDHVAALVERLSRLSVEELIAFYGHMERFWREAYDSRLFAAGSILYELDDDGFSDFLWWLVLQGKDVYSSVLKDPEQLAEILEPDDYVISEGYAGIFYNAYKLKTGREDFWELVTLLDSPTLRNEDLVWQTPEGWADPIQLKALFPKLLAKFGSRSDGSSWG